MTMETSLTKFVKISTYFLYKMFRLTVYIYISLRRIWFSNAVYSFCWHKP